MNILLIGDDCLDIYNFGVVEKISQEAPVPIFNYQYSKMKSGMVSNVHDNLTTLGLNVFPHKSKQSKKTRLIDTKFNHQILRIDEDIESECFDIELIRNDISYDCIVICDYNKGFISYELVKNLRKTFTVPIFIDTKKKDIQQFEGCFVKINNLEHQQLTSMCSELIVTHGSNPVTYKSKCYDVPKIEITDVCGAGDTFLSALVYKYLYTNNLDDAIEFAIKASSITVKHLGVYSPSLEEIL